MEKKYSPEVFISEKALRQLEVCHANSCYQNKKYQNQTAYLSMLVEKFLERLVHERGLEVLPADEAIKKYFMKGRPNSDSTEFLTTKQIILKYGNQVGSGSDVKLGKILTKLGYAHKTTTRGWPKRVTKKGFFITKKKKSQQKKFV